MQNSDASRREKAKPYPLSWHANVARRFALAARDFDIPNVQTKRALHRERP
jgi:hypothetical protein